MAEILEQHIPCPCGKSSDAYCTYDDGSAHCFSCNKHRPPANPSTYVGNVRTEVYAHRGITTDTFNKYGTVTKFVDDTPKEVGFVYPNSGVKVRNLDKKKFVSVGDMKGPMLFGRNVFEAGGPIIYITEGEYDAHSVYQMTRQPSVSVKSASSAKSDCKAEWDYLNSFDKIVLAFDNDDPGQAGARAVASLFDFNKVFNIQFTKYKDANKYLEESDEGDLQKALSSAKKYTPDNIISSFEDISKSLTDSREDKIGTYPYTDLQNALHGLHKGELIVFKGDEGIGKTEVFRGIQDHLLKENINNRLGIIHLEEDKATTIRGIATYAEKIPFLHPESSASHEDVMQGYRKAVGGKDDRVYIYESFDTEDENALIDNIRFLVSACGVNFIFLDHITWLATGQESEDERRKLDRLSQKFKYLAKELDFCFIIISHTNDDGKTRGSRNITKVANTVIHMSRDKVSPIIEIKLQTHFAVEKARIAGGMTGPAGFATYDIETCTLGEVE